MKLQGPNLSEGMRGDDVKLLQQELGILHDAGKLDIQIDQSEISRNYFGDTTSQAVKEFKQKYHLHAAGTPLTEIVDAHAAKLINAVVDALHPDSESTHFIVKGRITDKKEEPAPSLLVRAFDEDPGTGRDLLGTVFSNEEGEYTIHYTDEQFKRPIERGGADIIVMVYTPEGELLKETERHPNAGQEKIINVSLDQYPPECFVKF